MSDLGEQIVYLQLLKRHGRIRIPLLQRDYAQGRPKEQEIREEFLRAIESALRRPANDPSLPLNLDFIYGSVEGFTETCFAPLDGQQRLTTLFLLHWYLAWTDNRWTDFRAIFYASSRSRFTYAVRPSSNEFFDELVVYEPECQPPDVDRVSELISDQSWYFRSWRLDPTIQAALVMLDAIHNRFASSKGLFERLTSDSEPAITFQLLDLDNFGLSDDLYIKMNARGKPLTPFETFKARYEQELEKQFRGELRTIDEQPMPIADFVARRLDTTWSDLFWAHRDRETNLYDNALMNLLRTVALVTRDPESKSYLDDIKSLRTSWDPPSYSTFHARGWLDRNFTNTLISLLEAWSAPGGSLGSLLPDSTYFDEEKIFEKLIHDASSLTLPEVTQFTGYTLFIMEHERSLNTDAFQEWMRVVHNLSVNSNIERPEELRSAARGLREILPQATCILQYLSGLPQEDRIVGFYEQQVREELLKARLILNCCAWRPLIDRAELHGYFRGQIEFLLDFSGIVAAGKDKSLAEGDEDLHRSLQEGFEGYLAKAELMFGEQGLRDLEKFRWERALLSIGDYLLPSGRQNVSFLVNSTTDTASWKRLLKGVGTRPASARKLLRQLWDRLSDSSPVEKQLDEIIASACVPDAWRETIVRTPEAIHYCGNRAIRWNGPDEVYLLKKTQMNGAHAELFSFSLYHRVLRPCSNKGRLEPLVLHEYQSVNGTDINPYISLEFPWDKGRTCISVEYNNGRFIISINCQSLRDRPDIEDVLLRSLKFVQNGKSMSKSGNQAFVLRTMLNISKSVLA